MAVSNSVFMPRCVYLTAKPVEFLQCPVKGLSGDDPPFAGFCFLRLRLKSAENGLQSKTTGAYTEFGEKQNDFWIGLRARYYF
jgi:hypothetical protein